MDKEDLYDAVRRNSQFENAQFIIIPLIEKTVKNDSGHWLIFVIDFAKTKFICLTHAINLRVVKELVKQ